MRSLSRKRTLAVAASTAIATAMVAVPSAAEAQRGADFAFEAWDADSDGSVTLEEFRAAMADAGTFGAFDRDRNLGLDRTEMKSGVFRSLDEDGDGDLEPEEFRRGWIMWFRSEPPELTAIDVDGDGVVDESEFENADVDLGTFSASEPDAEVSEAEFYAGIYESWDENADERLAEDEWYRNDGDWPPTRR